MLSTSPLTQFSFFVYSSYLSFFPIPVQKYGKTSKQKRKKQKKKKEMRKEKIKRIDFS
jgi:hypothetical protein